MPVDFNLSLDPHHIAGTSAGIFGGSLGYMSPEQLDAFNPRNPIHCTTPGIMAKLRRDSSRTHPLRSSLFS